jgi:hypothetical protein
MLAAFFLVWLLRFLASLPPDLERDDDSTTSLDPSGQASQTSMTDSTTGQSGSE